MNYFDGLGKKIKTCDELKNMLIPYNGTEHYFNHWTKAGVYTDGVKAMAESCGAYWLLDVIFTAQRAKTIIDHHRVYNCPFQLWKISSDDNKGVVSMRQDSDAPLEYQQKIKYTDFPVGVFEMYFTNGMLLLKGEY